MVRPIAPAAVNVDHPGVDAAQCDALFISIQPPPISHFKACLGLFARNNFRRRAFIGYYYGSLVHSNHSWIPHQRRTYLEALWVWQWRISRLPLFSYISLLGCWRERREFYGYSLQRFFAGRFNNYLPFFSGDKHPFKSRKWASKRIEWSSKLLRSLYHRRNFHISPSWPLRIQKNQKGWWDFRFLRVIIQFQVWYQYWIV